MGASDVYVEVDMTVIGAKLMWPVNQIPARMKEFVVP